MLINLFLCRKQNNPFLYRENLMSGVTLYQKKSAMRLASRSGLLQQGRSHVRVTVGMTTDGPAKQAMHFCSADFLILKHCWTGCGRLPDPDESEVDEEKLKVVWKQHFPSLPTHSFVRFDCQVDAKEGLILSKPKLVSFVPISSRMQAEHPWASESGRRNFLDDMEAFSMNAAFQQHGRVLTP